MALLIAVCGSLAVIVAKVVQQALALLERIESEGGAVDLVAIVNSAQASSYGDSAIKCATWVLIVSWIVSIIDAYLLGRKMDLLDQEKIRTSKEL
jgi:hypothetical protein